MKDKIAFVTGGGSGIGRACALALAAQGARVVVVGRTLAKCDAVVAEIGGASALAVAVLVSDTRTIHTPTLPREGGGSRNDDPILAPLATSAGRGAGGEGSGR